MAQVTVTVRPCHFFGTLLAGTPETDRQVYPGDREAVRRQAVIHALEGALQRLDA